MSKLDFKNGKFFLHDGASEIFLLDVLDWSSNKSRLHSHQLTEDGDTKFPLSKTVNQSAKKIFRNTLESMAEVVIYLRTVARLLVKPQIHHVLRIGSWSSLDEELAKILPQFNPKNKLYCLSKTRPPEKFTSVNFLLTEGEFPLPEKTFDTIIFPEHKTPPPEILLAARDFGKIYFAAKSTELDDLFRPTTKIFGLTDKISLFETELTPIFRKEIFRRTPQGQLEQKKFFVKQTVANFLPTAKKINALSVAAEKNFLLDKYLAELTRAEKILAEIFPSLPDAEIKFNFNLFKEFLLDVRLVDDLKSQKISSARAVRQHEILTQSLL